MRYARLGPSSVLVRVLIGAKAEQHVLAAASSSSKQQAVKKSLRPHRGSKPASKQLKMTGEQRRITTNKFRCVSSRLARSTADLVSKKWPFLGCFRLCLG